MTHITDCPLIPGYIKGMSYLCHLQHDALSFPDHLLITPQSSPSLLSPLSFPPETVHGNHPLHPAAETMCQPKEPEQVLSPEHKPVMRERPWNAYDINRLPICAAIPGIVPSASHIAVQRILNSQIPERENKVIVMHLGT